ncbi:MULTISPECIES: amino-acid N-acetyltransferase [Brevibacterium]|jgi:amino-acid N-acetyltransferase|uniref:Amino-acid N-acetyltransferase n=1 Tax=Brevibacterium salitolerans TaxID=1403566 RepID=A0ABN2WUV2_9MICO|nr:amino-acid N-acetyltransferase [Brevibacterium sp.]
MPFADDLISAQYRSHELPHGLVLRRARATDVPALVKLLQPMVEQRILVAKERVDYYEAIHEFWLVVDPQAEGGEALVGCAACHVIWEDTAEARTIATDPAYRGRGVGRVLVEQVLADARAQGVRQVFCLTFETDFFSALGFEIIEGTPVSQEAYGEILRSRDEGTAEFLDLSRVKPNTLGNTRMLRRL